MLTTQEVYVFGESRRSVIGQILFTTAAPLLWRWHIPVILATAKDDQINVSCGSLRNDYPVFLTGTIVQDKITVCGKVVTSELGVHNV